MKWNHLPNEGGYYSQSPQFIDDLEIIFSIKAEHERSEAKKQEREMQNSSGRRGRSRMRR